MAFCILAVFVCLIDRHHLVLVSNICTVFDYVSMRALLYPIKAKDSGDFLVLPREVALDFLVRRFFVKRTESWAPSP